MAESRQIVDLCMESRFLRRVVAKHEMLSDGFRIRFCQIDQGS